MLKCHFCGDDSVTLVRMSLGDRNPLICAKCADRLMEFLAYGIKRLGEQNARAS